MALNFSLFGFTMAPNGSEFSESEFQLSYFMFLRRPSGILRDNIHVGKNDFTKEYKR